MITIYRDSGVNYLELHARRAPVGGYATWVTMDREVYDFTVACAVQDFEAETGVRVFLLGRSGRHVCVEDTPRNRRHYARLRKAALQAADRMWLDMRTEREPDAVLSEN